MRLFGVELSRLRTRPMFRNLVTLALVCLAAGVGFVAWDNRPPSAADRAEAAKAAERENAERDLEQERLDCRDAEDRERENDPEVDFGCEDIRPMTAGDYLGFIPYSFRVNTESVVVVTAVGLSLAAFLIGASSLGADITTGTLATQLLFEPRRTRVFAAKAAGLSVHSALLGALGIALALAGSYGIAWRWGDASGLTSGFWQSTGLAGLRGVAIVVVAALSGFALAAVLRHTAAAIGVLAVYTVGGEFVLSALYDDSRRWILTSNLNAWLRDGHQIISYDCPEFGGECVEQRIQLSLQQGGLVVGGLTLGALVLAWFVFRRRDIT